MRALYYRRLPSVYMKVSKTFMICNGQINACIILIGDIDVPTNDTMLTITNTGKLTF